MKKTLYSLACCVLMTLLVITPGCDTGGGGGAGGDVGEEEEANYSQADLEGTWSFNSEYVEGIITFDKSGLVGDGSLLIWKNLPNCADIPMEDFPAGFMVGGSGYMDVDASGTVWGTAYAKAQNIGLPPGYKKYTVYLTLGIEAQKSPMTFTSPVTISGGSIFNHVTLAYWDKGSGEVKRSCGKVLGPMTLVKIN